MAEGIVEGTRMFYARKWIDGVTADLEKGAVNVAGGRGVGKTTLLNALYAEDKALHYRPPLQGRDARTTAALRQLSQNPEGSKQTILVDDADLLIFLEAEREMSTAMDLVGVLQDLRQRENTKLLLASTGKLYDWLNEQPDFLAKKIPFPPEFILKYSVLCTDLQIRILNPWFPGWQREWQRDFDRAMEPVGMSASARKLWSRAILTETGGHPALFGPVVRKIAELMQDNHQKLPPAYLALLGEKPQDEFMQRYIEEWIEEDGVRSVKSAIRRLRDSEEPVERRAFAYLVGMASGSVTQKLEDDPAVSKVLQDVSLITHDDEKMGEYIIPGRYLQRLLQRIGKRSSQTFQTLATTTVSHVKEDNRSQVIIMSRTGELHCTFTGGLEELFRVLEDAHGQVVSIDEITEKTKLKDERAVQNAVTRLRRKLERSNIEIVSERGRGYRLLKEIQGAIFH